jgi:hypothetical protein
MAEDPEMRDWAAELVERARSEGVELTGDDGLLTALVRQVLQKGLEVEMTDHLGYQPHAVEGRGSGNSRNGSYPKTVTTDIGQVDLQVPRDRNASFDPVTVPKGQRRLDGLTGNIISLYAKGLTTGDIQAHLAEIYGTDVSRDTISRITGRGGRGHGRLAEPAPRRDLMSIGGCERSEKGCSDASMGSQQDAGGGEAPVLRADPPGSEGRGGRSAGRGVDELRVAVVHRRWQRDHPRTTPDFVALLDPGRPDGDRRRPRRQGPGQGDRGGDRQELPDGLSRGRPRL